MLCETIDIPDALFEALEQDRLVIFTGAGISMGSPSKLPGFGELTQKIAKGTGIKVDVGGDFDKILEVLPDERAADTARETAQQDLAATAVALMDTLTERERKILAGLFGLHGGQKNSRQIAGELGVTRQTVYDLRNAALAKLLLQLHNLEFHL